VIIAVMRELARAYDQHTPSTWEMAAEQTGIPESCHPGGARFYAS
jgi:hypothetical protein